MEESKIYKLGEVCTKIGSGATPKGGKEAYLGGETSLIRSQNVLDFSFSWDGLAYINDEQASKLNSVELERNDVLLNITGDSVARACIVPDKALPARVNQHVAIIRGNQSVVLNEYILYYLQFKKQFLLSLSQGGATRNALTKGMIEKLEITLPTLNKQKEIVSILKSLDDKIEVNRRINENLELQAQALFKSWFVDFEPFKDGEFVESELGMIPKGWRVGTLGDICVTNKRLYKGNFTYDIEYIDTGSITNNMIDSTQILKPATDKIPSRARRAVTEGDIIYSSVRPNQRHYALLFNPSSNTVVSTGFVVITAIWSGYRYYIYQYLIQDEIVDKLQAIAEQSVSTFPSLNAADITNMEIVIPPNDVVGDYAAISCSIREQIEKNQQESRRLAAIRDTLIPRLMSGGIKVD